MIDMRNRVRVRLLWLFACFLLFACSLAYAADKPKPARAVVFLLDASNSMNASDPQGLVLDAARGMAHALPSDWPVGLVAYNTGVQVVCEAGLDRSALENAVGQVRYTGYTDAGAGLAQAVQLLEVQSAVEKAIVLVSDGEITLGDAAETAESKQQFDALRKKASSLGIAIYTIALGNAGQEPEINVYGAEKILYRAASAEELPQIVRRVLFEDFAVPRIAVSSGGVQSGALQAKFPLQKSERLARAKVLLVSDGPIGSVSASYQAGDGAVRQGQYLAVVDLERPQGDAVEVRLDFARRSGIWADLLLEMQADVAVETAASEDADLLQVRLTPCDAADRSMKLLADPYFAGKPVRVLVDGEPVQAKVSDGAVCFTVPADAGRTAQVRALYADLGVHMIAPETVAVSLAPPKSYGALLAAAAAGAALLAAFVWRRRRPKPVPEPPPPVSRYEYAGQLKLYVMQAPDDSDVAPLRYNLYRCFDRREISLGAILEDCNLPFTLPGAHKILFAPGANKALVLTNRSDCTVLKNKELLIKGHSCLVHFNEGVHITFEDERSAMLLEYKTVKPSERH